MKRKYEVIGIVIDTEKEAEKDVDCFSPINSAKIMEGDKSGFPPCTPTAVVEILKHYNVPLNGANVVVLGRSMVVGKPAAMLCRIFNYKKDSEYDEVHERMACICTKL